MVLEKVVVFSDLKRVLDTGVQKITDSKSDMRHVFTNIYGIGPKMLLN